MGEERSAGGFDQRVGERVRARRLELGMSQERLAEILGVTFQQVQKYEKGVNRIAAGRLLDMSLALDTPVAHFFDGLGGAKDNGKSAPLETALATPDVVQLVRLFHSIKNVKVRKRVLELVQVMAGEN